MKHPSGQFERGVALFNQGKFFEAHEAWEESWLAEHEPEKIFLQGLIQVAAAFHHAQRRNTRGMRSLLAAGLAKLSQFAGDHRGIGVRALCEEARTCLELWGKHHSAMRKFPKITNAGEMVEGKAAGNSQSECAAERRAKTKPGN